VPFAWVSLLLVSQINLDIDEAHTANMRFSDIWADEWKSGLHIAIQLLSGLKDHR